MFSMLAKRSYANPTSLPDLFVFNVKLATFLRLPVPSFTQCADLHSSNSFEEACFPL